MSAASAGPGWVVASSVRTMLSAPGRGIRMRGSLSVPFPPALTVLYQGLCRLVRLATLRAAARGRTRPVTCATVRRRGASYGEAADTFVNLDRNSAGL
ncbi:Protein of unknown function [Micromonospora lupini str. Lupac 08]|uniref:Uncharacterized protein n=1 Tax=Micromonospora lupini str. Lupac 08 TaxID=1150864 RepID=I0L9Q7_9ACTN|nr:Protein of unknown function [Micromonospora lupini str. Lupac 08]